MHNPPQQEEIDQALRDLQRAPSPAWVEDMISHYQRTGTYRPADLRRLLGDPNQVVSIGPETSTESLLASALPRLPS
jgi:hypothetical protein